MNTDVKLLLVGFLTLMGLDPDMVLMEGIQYNPLTGELFWRETHSKSRHGYTVGSKTVPTELRESAAKFFTPVESGTDE